MRARDARKIAGACYISCPLCGVTEAQLRDGGKAELMAIMKAHLRQQHSQDEVKAALAQPGVRA